MPGYVSRYDDLDGGESTWSPRRQPLRDRRPGRPRPSPPCGAARSAATPSTPRTVLLRGPHVSPRTRARRGRRLRPRRVRQRLRQRPLIRARDRWISTDGLVAPSGAPGRSRSAPTRGRVGYAVIRRDADRDRPGRLRGNVTTPSPAAATLAAPPEVDHVARPAPRRPLRSASLTVVLAPDEPALPREGHSGAARRRGQAPAGRRTPHPQDAPRREGRRPLRRRPDRPRASRSPTPPDGRRCSTSTATATASGRRRRVRAFPQARRQRPDPGIPRLRHERRQGGRGRLLRHRRRRVQTPDRAQGRRSEEDRRRRLVAGLGAWRSTWPREGRSPAWWPSAPSRA